MHPRESLKILSEHCPLYSPPLATCPLSEIRTIPPQEREKFLASLSEMEVEALIRGHILCACRKQGCHV